MRNHRAYLSPYLLHLVCITASLVQAKAFPFSFIFSKRLVRTSSRHIHKAKKKFETEGIHCMKLATEDKTIDSERICQSISSEEAANLIQLYYNRDYDRQKNFTSDNNDDDNLLIITTDASRGSNRYSGFASIIRQTSTKLRPTEGITSDHEIESMDSMDKVIIVTRRMQSLSSKNIAQSEINATILGMKTALQQLHIKDRQRILLLTDSASVISFFAHENFHYRREQSQYQQDYKVLHSLLKDQKGQTDSSFIKIAKVKSAHQKEDGFFDHEVADILSKHAIRTPNKVSLFQTCEPTTVPRLCETDIEYLRSSSLQLGSRSTSILQGSHSQSRPLPRQAVRQTQVQINRANSERLSRCKERMEKDLRITL